MCQVNYTEPSDERSSRPIPWITQVIFDIVKCLRPRIQNIMLDYVIDDNLVIIMVSKWCLLNLLDDDGAKFVERKRFGIFAIILVAIDSRTDVKLSFSWKKPDSWYSVTILANITTNGCV